MKSIKITYFLFKVSNFQRRFFTKRHLESFFSFFFKSFTVYSVLYFSNGVKMYDFYRCDRCTPGFWSFPFCQLCDCDLRGTEDDICNQVINLVAIWLRMIGVRISLFVYFLKNYIPNSKTYFFIYRKMQVVIASEMLLEDLVILVFLVLII